MSNTNFIDEAKALRDSDSFDVVAVHNWLKKTATITAINCPK